MDIKGKIAYLERGIDSIASHEDEDAALRKAALDKVIALCETKKGEIDQAVQAVIDAQVG